MRTILLITALLVSSLVFARPPHGAPMPIDAITEALSLDADQATQVNQILSAQHERMMALRDLDRSERRGAMQRAREELRGQLQSVLSVEQMERFEELLAARRARRGGGERMR